MLIYEYTPSVLLQSTIMSIPKDYEASLSSSDIYRGIYLFNCICKLYDHVILHLFRKEMQFGFKEHHSTTLCSLIFLQKNKYIINNTHYVYSCLFDTSEVFHLVHYGSYLKFLFLTIFRRVLCVCTLIDKYIGLFGMIISHNILLFQLE